MYDLLIRGGTVIDGTGSPWFKADVAVTGDRIAAIGRFPASQAARVIDAAGRIVCPGLIDVHTHSDLTIAVDPRARSTLAQGVTTQIAGNCGVSAAPTRDHQLYYGPLDPAQTKGLDCDWIGFDEYFARLEATGTGTNYTSLLGHGNLRAAVIGYDDRSPSAAELDTMCEMADQAMTDGAIGLSTGLAYLPGMYAKPDEVTAIARVAAIRGGIYTSHIRNQTERIEAAVQELIDVARGAGIAAHVSHMQPGAPMLGATRQLLALMDRERAAGIDLSCDVVPYTVGSTTLKSMLPPWACEGGDAALMERLKDPATRARIHADTMTHGAESGGSRKRTLIKDGRWDVIWLASSERDPRQSGKSFRDLAAMRGQDAHDALLDILIEEGGKPWVLAEDVSETDIANIVTHPIGGVMSDGFSLTPEGVLGGGKHHPRSYGAFPRFLRRFVRENALLSWEAAIHKLTGYAASRFRIAERGLVREGCFADLLIFDKDAIADIASFDDPYRFPVGIDAVLVNGQIAAKAGALSETLKGRILRAGRRT